VEGSGRVEGEAKVFAFVDIVNSRTYRIKCYVFRLRMRVIVRRRCIRSAGDLTRFLVICWMDLVVLMLFRWGSGGRCRQRRSDPGGFVVYHITVKKMFCNSVYGMFFLRELRSNILSLVQEWKFGPSVTCNDVFDDIEERVRELMNSTKTTKPRESAPALWTLSIGYSANTLNRTGFTTPAPFTKGKGINSKKGIRHNG
jgi:hypothetical protein